MQGQYPDWNTRREDIKSALKVGVNPFIGRNMVYPPVERDEVYTGFFEQAENFKKNR